MDENIAGQGIGLHAQYSGHLTEPCFDGALSLWWPSRQVHAHPAGQHMQKAGLLNYHIHVESSLSRE